MITPAEGVDIVPALDERVLEELRSLRQCIAQLDTEIKFFLLPDTFIRSAKGEEYDLRLTDTAAAYYNMIVEPLIPAFAILICLETYTGLLSFLNSISDTTDTQAIFYGIKSMLAKIDIANWRRASNIRGPDITWFKKSARSIYAICSTVDLLYFTGCTAETPGILEAVQEFGRFFDVERMKVLAMKPDQQIEMIRAALRVATNSRVYAVLRISIVQATPLGIGDGFGEPMRAIENAPGHIPFCTVTDVKKFMRSLIGQNWIGKNLDAWKRPVTKELLVAYWESCLNNLHRYPDNNVAKWMVIAALIAPM